MEYTELIQNHRELAQELREIPKLREMECRIIKKDKQLIAKPRFTSKTYNWKEKKESYKKLIAHLEQVKQFFEDYYYWYDESIKDSLAADRHKESKKSVIFLLERDVWETDEVYGDYLIEIQEKEAKISYYRRKEKRKTFSLNTTDIKEIIEWIINDARQQIIKQFDFLWGLIELNLQTCHDVGKRKISTKRFTNEELRNQFFEAKKINSSNPILGILGLGRVAELWTRFNLSLKGLNQNLEIKSPRKVALESGIINKQQYKLLNNIANYYNKVKHELDVNPADSEIREQIQVLFDDFEKMID